MQQERNELSLFRDYFGCEQRASLSQLKEIAAVSAETINKMAAESANAIAMQKTAFLLNVKGAKVLDALWKNNTSFFGTEELDVLRVIVATDGTRPSYPVSNGIAQTALYENSEWKTLIDSRSAALKRAVDCTGRINLFNTPAGTGFLIAPNLIMTNRHVLQVITEQNNRTSFVNSVFIDFSCENPNTDGGKKVRVKKVVYTGPDEIGSASEGKQDMALLEIEDNGSLPIPIAVCQNCPDTKNTDIFLIGFPNQKSFSLSEGKVFRDFFESMMGYKKIAPGKIIDGKNIWPGRFCHDASTLRGNSGSLVVAAGKEECAIGLHYGGTAGPPSENWAHEMSLFCAPESELKQIFDAYNVEFA